MKVLAIVIRGLHLGYLGCYGNEWIRTPSLDRLASQSVVFDQHLADRPESAGFCRSWQTGQYSLPDPSRDQDAQSPPPCTLDRLLSEGGVVSRWITGLRASEAAEKVRAMLDDPASGDQWLLRVDLDDLESAWQSADAVREDYAQQAELDPDTALVTEAAPAIIEDDDDAILALQVSYGTAVTRLDWLLGELLKGIDEQTMILVTADRGQALGEHGIVGEYRPWLHDELVHVPLILRLPSGGQAERRVPALTQHADLMPTLCEAFGLEAPCVFGKSLWPLLRRKPGRPRLRLRRSTSRRTRRVVSADASGAFDCSHAQPPQTRLARYNSTSSRKTAGKSTTSATITRSWPTS